MNFGVHADSHVPRVFCHSQNAFWSVDHIDQEEIEAPKVPSGMTGGVEYEAMAYCVSLCVLSLSWARYSRLSPDDALQAHQHPRQDVPDPEGRPRVPLSAVRVGLRTCPFRALYYVSILSISTHTPLQTLRRASSAYYQTLHLEMARYVALARGVQFLLPPRILGVLDARTLAAEERRSLDAFQRRHPVSRHGAPQLAEPSF